LYVDELNDDDDDDVKVFSL